MLNNCVMKKWLFAITLFIIVVLNVLFLQYTNNSTHLVEELEQNHDQVSYQKLFDNTWAEIKDNYGANQIRVKGHLKVFCHLMFGVIALTVKQIYNYFA